MVSIKTYKTHKFTIIFIAEDLGSYDYELNFRVRPGVKRILVGKFHSGYKAERSN